MKTLRSIGAVLFGYMLFAMATLAFFKASGIAPHGEVTPVQMAGSIVVGMVAALAGGYAAARLAGSRPAAHGKAVAVVLIAIACISLAKTVGHGSIWSQLAALFLMAPCAAYGGQLRQRQQQ